MIKLEKIYDRFMREYGTRLKMKLFLHLKEKSLFVGLFVKNILKLLNN